MKRQMKAEKKAADKEGKVKDQKESGDTGAQDGDEETLDPNVRFFLKKNVFSSCQPSTGRTHFRAVQCLNH